MLIKVDRSCVVVFCEIAQTDKHAGALMMMALERRGGSRGDEEIPYKLSVLGHKSSSHTLRCALL